MGASAFLCDSGRFVFGEARRAFESAMRGQPMYVGTKAKRVVTYAMSFILSLLLGLLASFAYEQSVRSDVVPRGVEWSGSVVSGLEKGDLERLLRARNERMGSRRIHVSLNSQKKTFELGELGVSIDVDRVAEQVLSAGRKGSSFRNFWFWLGRLFSSYEVPTELDIDEKKLTLALEPWAPSLLEQPELPSLSYDKELVVSPGRGGTVIEYPKLRSALRNVALAELRGESGQGQSATLDVPTKVEAARIAKEVVDRVTVAARALLSAPVTIVAPDGHSEVVLSPQVLGKALVGRVDEEKATFVLEIAAFPVREAMKAFLSNWERPPREAAFEFPQNSPPIISPSEIGRSLDAARLGAALLAFKENTPRRVSLPLRDQVPKLTTADAEGLHVKGLVMSFTTRHPCCQPRVDNIHHAAKQLDGVVLRPGERFSLNELLGPRHESSGYHKAPTIVRGEMEDVHGGGISQLATTLFNAVLRGGYEIVQRQPHSVYFPRYPEGHEATVSYPEPDLIFRNDSDAGMVIKTNAASTYITVLIYGDNGGRITTVDKGHRYNIVEPPKEYEPDEEMAPEKVKRLGAGQLGWTVVVSRKVKYADGTEKIEKREVVYNPRPELLRVHPCQIPEGEEGHTGEECPELDIEIEEEEEELSEDAYFETQ